jgi:cytochrome c553
VTEARPAKDAARFGAIRARMLFSGLREQIGDLARQLRDHLPVLLLFSAALFAGGLLFAWSGVYSVAATSGHYPFFRVFLGYALEQSVATHTIGITPPPLDDPAMVRRGAGHYQGGCSPCHGAPSQARNPITRRMLPESPYLPDRVEHWSPKELFWIVKNGIKYAGMPAWVAPAREDEAWSVVAFLLRLPDMDPATYRRLAFGEAADAIPKGDEGLRLLLLNGPVGGGIAACARCHGFDGNGDATGAFPRLTGQTEAYLYEALKGYSLGTRPSGIMQPVASELGDEEMRLLAAHYAALPAAAPAPQPADGSRAADPAALALGRRIAHEGLPDRGVAACAGCHGPKQGPQHPLFPRLAGQPADYVATQLELWMKGVRGGRYEGQLARVMAHAVGAPPDRASENAAVWSMAREQMRAVALFYASLPPAEPAAAVAEARRE